MEGEAGSSLRFPDVPKLELDDLIDQLVDRARGVQRAQGRLRALLRAIETVTGDLSLEVVLRNVVESACELSGARYGALGVIAHDGGLDQFIHVGMDDGAVAEIGGLPQGKGLLGALISDPRPIRLKHMVDDERSTGFPPHHPPMDSFLGVPIHVRDEVFGNLYLTDSEKGEFTAEDEELVIALALAAGTAISNARLYQESRLQQRWLTASVEIGSQLLAAAGEDPLRMIARRAIDIADADVVSVGLLTPDGESLLIEVAYGVNAQDLVGQRFRLTETLAGRAVEERRGLVLRAGDDVDRHSHASSVLDAGPLMVLPLQSEDTVRGVLSLVRERGRPPFSASDLAMAAGFASHASVALELADSRAAEQKVVLLEDRERIARDLHDHVIQELFAIGLSLESAAALLGSDAAAAAQRIQQRVEDIDRTIRRIRTSIFALRGPLDLVAGGLRQRILEVATDLTPALGYPPHVSFSGLLDIGVSADLVDDVVATVREAVTNIAKHAHASSATIDVSATATQLTVTVTDDGVGLGDVTRCSGTGNLRARAEQRQGSFEIGPGATRGTIVKWKVPISHD
ncbi:MAG TPA: GAF domain-containing protein [Jatrophihabitans sp.]|uniref:GAF domain-containing sensor histidine kinase n=1 Tax=Jatrophihabitans sp. TaxID=1932789 RepID=UPI002DFBA725|nr:GAF domain-containing protein [Jatrophihabitans sp.]